MKRNANLGSAWEDADEALEGVELTDEQLEGIAGGTNQFLGQVVRASAEGKAPATQTGVHASANGRRC